MKSILYVSTDQLPARYINHYEQSYSGLAFSKWYKNVTVRKVLWEPRNIPMGKNAIATLMKCIIFVLAFFFTVSVYATNKVGVPLNAFHALSQSARSLDGCYVIMENAKYVIHPNKQSILVTMPFENCGGGNNWGFQTQRLSDYRDGVWHSVKNVDVRNVERISFEQGAYVIHWLDHGPNDPRCCPSIKRVTRLR